MALVVVLVAVSVALVVVSVALVVWLVVVEVESVALAGLFHPEAKSEYRRS